MIAGNCRMCLVEVERAPKPVASCAWLVEWDLDLKIYLLIVSQACSAWYGS